MSDEAERQDAFRRAGFIITADFGIREETEIIDGMADAITRLRAENARLREAVRLTEESENEWANCSECQETLRFPELCERCITLADQARLARRAALQETSDDQD